MKLVRKLLETDWYKQKFSLTEIYIQFHAETKWIQRNWNESNEIEMKPTKLKWNQQNLDPCIKYRIN